jgi:hypothetical protein
LTPSPAHSVNYTEAWIEFLDKQVAKSAAAMLNAQTIGGHKGEKYGSLCPRAASLPARAGRSTN